MLVGECLVVEFGWMMDDGWMKRHFFFGAVEKKKKIYTMYVCDEYERKK